MFNILLCSFVVRLRLIATFNSLLFSDSQCIYRDVSIAFNPHSLPVSVWVYDSAYCPSTLHFSAVIDSTLCVTGIKSIGDNQAEPIIFPVPTTDYIHIVKIQESNSRFLLYSSIGEKIMENNLNSESNIVDLGDLSPGVYYVTIVSKSISYRKTIIKQ